ncbi:MAG: hypothetical protein GX591_17345 [Planctomycetes bacterium]|nr:hypothetical protein [Planctomycetota bacterium]
MNFLPAGRRGPAVFQMTAMVDMVFILLTFFVMASRFNMPEKDFSTGAAEPSLAAGAAAEDFPAQIPIRVRRAGEAMSIAIGANPPVADLAALRAKLTEINMPAIGVLILADPALSVEQVASAVDAVLASPMQKVSLGMLETAEP